MSLMGSLYTGVSGLQTSNNALNTTAHNMSNMDTVGYTRQQVAQATRPYVTMERSIGTNWKQYGLGVQYSQTRQVRDIFLDKSYRRESGRSGFYDVSTSALEEIENILGESNEGHAFSRALQGEENDGDGLWVAIQELSKDPTNSVNQDLFVTKAYEFIERATAVYQSLSEYQDNMNKTIETEVTKLNNYALKLEALNEQIIKIEAGDLEHANDLRDQRNMILDELGKMGNISYEEDEIGYVSVKFEGVDLVKGGLVNKMDMYANPNSGFYTPYWTMLANFSYNEAGERVVTEAGIAGAKVFDLTRTVSSEYNTDVGSLRGILLARGDHRATYAELKDINKDGEYEEGWYNKNISQSIIMNIEAEFDQLINGVVTKINDILREAAEEAGPASDSKYLRDENGEPLQLFVKLIDEGDWTVSNITINQKLRQNPSLLGFRLQDGSEDIETMEKLKEAFEAKDYTLNPNVQTPVNYIGYYKNMISQVANSGAVFRAIQDGQTLATDALVNAREQIVGVSSDEELGNMIMFQNAYNASSRYINVISEMLDHLLSTLGR